MATVASAALAIVAAGHLAADAGRGHGGRPRRSRWPSSPVRCRCPTPASVGGGAARRRGRRHRGRRPHRPRRPAGRSSASARGRLRADRPAGRQLRLPVPLRPHDGGRGPAAGRRGSRRSTCSAGRWADRGRRPGAGPGRRRPDGPCRRPGQRSGLRTLRSTSTGYRSAGGHSVDHLEGTDRTAEVGDTQHARPANTADHRRGPGRRCSSPRTGWRSTSPRTRRPRTGSGPARACAGTPEVSIKGFPFLTQVVGGELDEVEVGIKDFEADGRAARETRPSTS